MRFSFLSLGFLAGVVFLLSSCGEAGKPDAAEGATDSTGAVITAKSVEITTPSAPLPTGGLRVAWVNMDSLLHGYDYYFDMEREMAELSSQAERELTEKGKALERKVTKFQDDMQKGLLTRSEAQRLQEELAQEQTRFLQLQEAKRQQLVEEEQVRLRKVQNAINEFIASYNAEAGYNYILSVGLLYADPRLSITSDVLNGLNADYAKQKATTTK